MTSLMRLLPLLLALVCVQACASTQGGANPDPYESVNRKIFILNDGLDRHLLAPVSRGYNTVMPGFAERGVSNFFANLYDFNGSINAVLQGRFLGAVQNGGRFIINSTVGMFGFLNIASEMGIPPYRTDFGHTLARWGASSGPYLMVPFFGPRTVRSGTGYIVDSVASVQWGIDSLATRAFLFGLEVIDTRAALADAEQLISGDRYIFLRDVYLQQREVFVNDGLLQDTFSDFDDAFDWEE